jgi:hypothetical protein
MAHAKSDYCPAQTIVSNLHKLNKAALQIEYFYPYKTDAEACKLRIESIDNSIQVINKESPHPLQKNIGEVVIIKFKALEPPPAPSKCPKIPNVVSAQAVDNVMLLGANTYQIKKGVLQGTRANVYGNFVNVEQDRKTGLPVVQIQAFSFCNLSKDDNQVSEFSIGSFIVVSGITDYGAYCSRTNEYGVTQKVNCLQIRQCKINYDLTQKLAKCAATNPG